MDFPSHEKNAARPTTAVTLSPPEVGDDATHEERLVAQQWATAKALRLGERHPLSLNRDSKYVS